MKYKRSTPLLMTAFLLAAGAGTAHGQEPVPWQQSYTAAQDAQMSRPEEMAAAPVKTDPSCAWISSKDDFDELWEQVKLRDIWPGSPCEKVAADRLIAVLEKKPWDERLKTYIWLYNHFSVETAVSGTVYNAWLALSTKLEERDLHWALDRTIEGTGDTTFLNSAARERRGKNPAWESGEEFMLRTTVEALYIDISPDAQDISVDAQTRYDATATYLLAATALSPFKRLGAYQFLMTKLTEEEMATFADKIFEAGDALPFQEKIDFLTSLEGYARKDGDLFRRLLEKKYETIAKDVPDRFVQAQWLAEMFLYRGEHLDKNLKKNIVDEIFERFPDMGELTRLEAGLKIAMCEDCAIDVRRRAALLWSEEIKKQEENGYYELVDSHLVEHSRTDGPLQEMALAMRFDNIDQISMIYPEKEEIICLLALNYLKSDNPRVPAAYARLMNILGKEPDPYKRTEKILKWLVEAEPESNLEKTLVGEWTAQIPMLSYEERIKTLQRAEEWRGRAISVAAQEIMMQEQDRPLSYIP